MADIILNTYNRRRDDFRAGEKGPERGHDNPAFLRTSSDYTVSHAQVDAEDKQEVGVKGRLFVEPAKQAGTPKKARDQSEPATGSPKDPRGSKSDWIIGIIKKMTCCKWKWSLLFNGVIILSLSGLIVVLEFDVIPFRSLGFRCQDPSLSHKFRGDTIPFAYLMAVSISVPLVAIFLVESLVLNSTQTYLTPEKRKNLNQAWHWYGQFFLGLLILLFLIQLGKSLVAEPRPHFFDTCKPDKANCTSGYVAEYVCTNRNLSKRDLRDSFRSFPSGHSALGVYVAIFMSWFFQKRIPRSDYLIVPWLQCLFLSWGLLCALTRITDRRHHWWDVFAGSIFGCVMAAFTVKIFCQNFHCHYSKRCKPERTLNDVGNNINHVWNRKLLSSTSSCSQPPDDRELREVK